MENSKYFKYYVGLSALLIAGSAAAFSVFGLSKLFAGAALSVIIMAGSLEFGKLVAADNSGYKYYESKSGKRWVIYNGEVEASKIPSEWYSWMHHTGNKIENSHELDKYSWQKEHMPNQTGTENSYHPKKNKSKNASNKKYTSWKS